MSEDIIEKDVHVDEVLQESIILQFQKHTGYAKDDLEIDADFESDLGIDSIILISVIADICKMYDLDVSKTENRFSSIRNVIAHIKIRLDEEGKSVISTIKKSTNNCIEKESKKKLKQTSKIQSDAKPDVVSNSSQSQVWASLINQINESTNKVSEPSNLSFLANGFAKKDLLKLHHELKTEHNLPDVIYLSDCDTPEKLQTYLNATKQHQVERLTTSGQQINEQNISYSKEDNDARTMMDFVSISNKDLFHKTKEFKSFYIKKQQSQLYWYGMPLESRCENRATIYDEITGKRREFLMFASNNYLGLANHPEVIEAIVNAVREFGATNTGCRLIGGSNILHKVLETKLANLKGREACIVYPSGYSANLGCISALVGRNDLVFTDAINHMSIQDGCKLSGASRKIYQHSMDSLEETLQKYKDHDGGKLIVTDGVFSMHGDIVDLPRMIDLAKKYGARILIDDAHSTGVLGKTGSGTTEHFDKKGEVDLELGTMSKALAGLGGFVCGDEEVIEYLRFYSNSYVFAATIPASVAAGLIASIDIMIREPERLSKLWRNIHHLRDKLLNAGFNLEHSCSAILPVVVGDDQKTLEFGRAVRARGMFCQTVVFPGVAVGDARLRISVLSEHTTEDLDLAAQILVSAAKEVNIPVTV